MVDTIRSVAAGEDEMARVRLRQVHALAEATFPDDDLRRLTAKANLAVVDRDPAALAAVAEQWHAGRAWLETLEGGIRARSSTFHLRLYRKDPSGFESVAERHMRRLWNEGLARLTVLAEPMVGAEAALGRWYRIAAHTGFGDGRKIATAAGLLLG